MEDALRLGSLIAEGLISSDEKLDVMAGAAGSIIGLLPLWEHSGRQIFLDRTAVCADHLLSRQIDENGNRGGWMTFAPRPLAGLSHGAAGIALALVRAFSATGVSKYLQAARSAIDYERSIFLPVADNWLDLRGQGKPPQSDRGVMVPRGSDSRDLVAYTTTKAVAYKKKSKRPQNGFKTTPLVRSIISAAGKWERWTSCWKQANVFHVPIGSMRRASGRPRSSPALMQRRVVSTQTPVQPIRCSPPVSSTVSPELDTRFCGSMTLLVACPAH